MLTINNEDVMSADLLSIEEASELPIWILANGDWWWLRSTGAYSYYAASVSGNGHVHTDGYYVYSNYGVRPALRIKNLDFRVIYDVSSTPRLEIGDLVEVFGLKTQYIGGNKVLLCEPIFNNQFDERSNVYETSKIKQKIDEWFGKRKECS